MMLTDAQRRTRYNVRNFLLIATREELNRELQLSIERRDDFRASCVRELLGDLLDEEQEQLTPDQIDAMIIAEADAGAAQEAQEWPEELLDAWEPFNAERDEPKPDPLDTPFGTITRERAREIWANKKYGDMQYTEQEDKIIRHVWDQMDGSSSWASAFFRFLNRP